MVMAGELLGVGVGAGPPGGTPGGSVVPGMPGVDGDVDGVIVGVGAGTGLLFPGDVGWLLLQPLEESNERTARAPRTNASGNESLRITFTPFREGVLSKGRQGLPLQFPN